MTLSTLISNIETAHNTFQVKALQSVSINLTLRNFVIGYYIVEYEQNGSDRVTYGQKVIENLAQKLVHIKGISSTALKLMRQFYLTYPQISQSLTDQFLQVPIYKLLQTTSITYFIRLRGYVEKI
ncbi:MAG: DUF1016 N-terminal domain-containing protein [Campylobacterota bacterium]